MPSTYSSLKIELMATGEKNTTWGSITNINLGTALEEAIVGSADVTFASGDVTLTLTDTNATQTARNVRLRCTGTTGGVTRNLVVPSIEKPYIVRNDCADNIVVKTAAGTGITVPAGRTMWVYTDGTNVVDAVTHLSSLTLTTALPVAQGGTGATAAPAARTNLGATTIGSNLFTLTNPSAITFPRFNADNTVTARTAADFRSDIGAGTGTVTSVAASGGTTGLTFTGGPITTSGTLTLGGTLAVANGGTGTATAFTAGSVVFAGASGTYSQDNSNLFWDDANNRLGVRTASPSEALTVAGRVRSAVGGQTVDLFHDGTNASLASTTALLLYAGGANSLILHTNGSARLTLDSTGGITSSNLANAVGYKGLPQNPKTASYTLALTDMGYDIYITGTTAAQTITIPANASVAFPNGTMIQITNDSNQNWSIAITTDTLLWSPNNVTGTRTLAPAGQVTVRKVSATRWWISGVGLT